MRTTLKSAREETDRAIDVFESYAAQVEDGVKQSDEALALSLLARVVVASLREHSEANAHIAGVRL